MLLRIMSSNSDRPREAGSANGNGSLHTSLNSFVVNHQTPLGQSKTLRRKGLLKVPPLLTR